MTIEFPELPYSQNALEPYISENTLSFHYGKHHQAYVTNLNNLIKGTEFENLELAKIIYKASKEKNNAIFNNAAQVWNHSFYWKSMKKNGGEQPSGELLSKINEDFGNFDSFKEQFAIAGTTQFGSGWAWLVYDTKAAKLEIVKTDNANLPHPKLPLITMDIWEHAYYLDYQNARPKYINDFINNLINWEFAEQNFTEAKENL